jgi:hypothetical protein
MCGNIYIYFFQQEQKYLNIVRLYSDKNSEFSLTFKTYNLNVYSNFGLSLYYLQRAKKIIYVASI